MHWTNFNQTGLRIVDCDVLKPYKKKESKKKDRRRCRCCRRRPHLFDSYCNDGGGCSTSLPTTITITSPNFVFDVHVDILVLLVRVLRILFSLATETVSTSISTSF